MNRTTAVVLVAVALLAGGVVLACFGKSEAMAGTMVAGALALGAELKRTHTEKATAVAAKAEAEERTQQVLESTQTILVERDKLQAKLDARNTPGS